jgi:hypothetical protein
MVCNLQGQKRGSVFGREEVDYWELQSECVNVTSARQMKRGDDECSGSNRNSPYTRVRTRRNTVHLLRAGPATAARKVPKYLHRAEEIYALLNKY